MVTVTINNKEVSVEEGTLILDAARIAGFHIPTFCYQARLSSLGSCRMCLVEIEGQRKMQPSCVTPVMQDMVIDTQSPTVVSARNDMLEFLLSNHAMDCPVCDKGGECELQDMVMRHGPHKGCFAEVKNRFHDRDYILSPVIVKNSNRCVQCMRCVRVCREVVGVNALGSVGRGAWQEETSFLKKGLDCDHCGNCIEVCPVGSFMRLPYRYKSRPWDLVSAETVCTYCGTGCRMTVQSRNNEIIRVTSDPETGINNETLCARGRFGYDFVNSPERLKKPLVRDNGVLRESTWAEALGFIKDKFQKCAGEEIGGIASSRLTNEELFLFQKLFRDIFMSSNLDSDCRWEDASAAEYVSAMRLYDGGRSVFDVMDCNTMFIAGASISDETPVTDYIIRRISSSRWMNVIIASPRSLKLDDVSSLSLRTAPQSEGTLFSAIAVELFKAAMKRGNLVIDKDLSMAVEDVSSSLANLNIEEATSLSRADIVMVSKRFMQGKSVSILVGTDFLRYGISFKGLTVMTRILESLGKRVNLFPLIDRCNQRGAWDMGVSADWLPGYVDIGGGKRGMGSASMIESAVEGDIKVLYVAGDDIVSLFPDRQAVLDAIARTDCLVVQDMFLTETAILADVVLPSAAFTEKEGTLTNQEGRVQRINRLVAPPGYARTDIDIISSVGRVFDSSFHSGSPSEVFDLVKASVPMYRDLDYNALSGRDDCLTTASDNRSSLFEIKEVCRSLKKGTEGDDFQFILVTGNHLLHSGYLSQRSEILKSLSGRPFMEIVEEDALKLGIYEGDEVVVEGKNSRGKITVKVVRGSLSGVAFIPENFSSFTVNAFLKSRQRFQRVNIRKI